MDTETQKNADFTVTQASEVSSSTAMEKSGFERSLKYLKDCGVKIDCSTTDRHISISSFMDKGSGIKHQYNNKNLPYLYRIAFSVKIILPSLRVLLK